MKRLVCIAWWDGPAERVSRALPLISRADVDALEAFAGSAESPSTGRLRGLPAGVRSWFQPRRACHRRRGKMTVMQGVQVLLLSGAQDRRMANVVARDRGHRHESSILMWS